MKKIIIIFSLFFAITRVSGQTMPGFLQGTWKMSEENIYEHCDSLSSNHLKGVSYIITEGNVVIIEYLEITVENGEIAYTATIPGHNDGRPIIFIQTASDTAFVYENPQHDFPDKIVYKQISPDEIDVILSGNGREMTYSLEKYIENKKSLQYDKKLADLYGADELGMKLYTFVILKTGKSVIDDQQRVNEIFRGHLDNISRLSEEGKLIVAGPIMANEKEYRGIYIFNVTDPEEVSRLLETDPAIKAGLLEAETFSWYGSAALPAYLNVHKKIEKQHP